MQKTKLKRVLSGLQCRQGADYKEKQKLCKVRFYYVTLTVGEVTDYKEKQKCKLQFYNVTLTIGEVTKYSE